MEENKEPIAEDEDVEAHRFDEGNESNEERAGNEEPDVEGHLLLSNESNEYVERSNEERAFNE